MIDTVVFRFHGINERKNKLHQKIAAQNGHGSEWLVPEHHDLYRAMLQFKGKYFHAKVAKMREHTEVSDRDTDDYLTRNYHEKQGHVMLFIDEDKVKELNMSIKGDFIPSSYNGVTFQINENQGYIDFQLSIPKYLYGHSLAEFVPQINSEQYNANFHKAHTWSYQSQILYNRLISFLDIFCEDLCNFFQLDVLPNKKYIELRRLDLTFNQWFNNKIDALRYLEHLRVINHGRYKSNQKAPTDYNTSITYHSSTGAYFKVYHKGTEYSKAEHGDLKKHMDINRKYAKKVLDRLLRRAQTKEAKKSIFDVKRNFSDVLMEMGKGDFDQKNYSKEELRLIKRIYKAMPYKIDFFKKQTDRVLRFEVSLKGQFMSYYYKTKCFRRNCEYHNNAFVHYKESKSKMDSRTKESDLDRRELRNYKMMHSFLYRRAFLMFDGSRWLKAWQTNGTADYDSARDVYRISRFGLNNTLMHDRDVGVFDDYFLKWCVRYFKKIVEDYHVETMHPDDDLERRIMQYNADVSARVEAYNEANLYRIYSDNGAVKKKNGKPLTNAVQLLTEAQKSKLGLKKVRPMIMLAINEQIKRKRTIKQIRKNLKISDSQWSRYKRDLDKFGITAKTLIDPEPIETVKDWGVYYDNLDEMGYFSKFYANRFHATYD